MTSTTNETALDAVQALVADNTMMVRRGDQQDLVQVGVHFFAVVPNLQPQEGLDHEALRVYYAARLRALLPQVLGATRLAQGPSYIEIGAALGSQELALRLIGLGEYLRLWAVVTPQRLSLQGDAAEQAAGMGLVCISGWRKE